MKYGEAWEWRIRQWCHGNVSVTTVTSSPISILSSPAFNQSYDVTYDMSWPRNLIPPHPLPSIRQQGSTAACNQHIFCLHSKSISTASMVIGFLVVFVVPCFVQYAYQVMLHACANDDVIRVIAD